MAAFENPHSQGGTYYFQPSEPLPMPAHVPLPHDHMFPMHSTLVDDALSGKQPGALGGGGPSVDLPDDLINVEGRYMSDEDIIELICPPKIPSDTYGPEEADRALAELGDEKAWPPDQHALGLHKMQETMRPLSTRRSYHQNVRHFIQWCQQQKCRPIPTSDRVAAFLSHRLTHPWGQARKLTESTLKLSVSALQDARNKLERRTGAKIAGLRQSPVIRSLSKEVPKTNAAAAAQAAAQAAALAAAGGAGSEGVEDGRGTLNGAAAHAEDGEALPVEHALYFQQQQQQQQEAYARSQGHHPLHHAHQIRQQHHEQFGGHPGEDAEGRGAHLVAGYHSSSEVTDVEESAAGMMMMMRGGPELADQAAVSPAVGYVLGPGGMWVQQQQQHPLQHHLAAAMQPLAYYGMSGAELAQENGDTQGGEDEDEEEDEQRSGAGNEAQHGMKRKLSDAALSGDRSHIRPRVSSSLSQPQPWPSGAPRSIPFGEEGSYGVATWPLQREDGLGGNETLVPGAIGKLEAPYVAGAFPQFGIPVPQILPAPGGSRAEYSFAGEDDTIGMIWAKFWQRGFGGEKPIVLWMAFIGREEWLRRLATGDGEKQQQLRAWWHRGLPILLEILVRLKRGNLDVEDALAEVERLLTSCVPPTVAELSSMLRYSVPAARTLGAFCPGKDDEVALLERVVKDRRDAHYLPNPNKVKKAQ